MVLLLAALGVSCSSGQSDSIESLNGQPTSGGELPVAPSVQGASEAGTCREAEAVVTGHRRALSDLGERVRRLEEPADNWEAVEQSEHRLRLMESGLPILEQIVATMDRYEDCFRPDEFSRAGVELAEARTAVDRYAAQVWSDCMFMYEFEEVCGPQP